MTEPGFAVRPRNRGRLARLASKFWASIPTSSTRRLGDPWEAEPAARWAKSAELLIISPGMPRSGGSPRATDGSIGYASVESRGRGLLRARDEILRASRRPPKARAERRARLPRRGDVRGVIATTEIAYDAARYYRCRTVARFPIVGLEGAPHPVAVDPGRRGRGVSRTARDVEELDAIDAAVLEFSRGDEFAWLLETREGYLYRRDGGPIGFAFVDARHDRAGRWIATRPGNQVAILARRGDARPSSGGTSSRLELPMVNEVAIRASARPRVSHGRLLHVPHEQPALRLVRSLHLLSPPFAALVPCGGAVGLAPYVR